MGRKQRGADEDDQRNAMTHIHGEPSRGWEPPQTTFPSWVDGGHSVFGVAGFMAAPSIGGFLRLDPSSLLVLIFPFQAAIRSRSFNRTTCPRDINLAAQAVLKRPASIFGLVVLVMEILVFTVLPSAK